MPRLARRRPVAGVALAAALGLGGCAGATDSPVLAPVDVVGSGGATGAEAAALDALLDRREAAARSGDDTAFADTVADPASPEGARQLLAFRSLQDLGVTSLAHDDVPVGPDPASGTVVRVRYRVEGIDEDDRETAVRYRLTHRDSGWRVAAEEPTGGGAAAPWLAMPGLRVDRGEHAVVAGKAEPSALALAVRTVDGVLPGLRRTWPDTPTPVLVLLPGTTAEAQALLGRRTAGVGEVAATTEGPRGPDGRATGDRVVVDPEARARLTEEGQEVVLAHELAHVAVRANLAGSPPRWLSEGYADHVGYGRADLPEAALVAPLARAVRRGAAPRQLPSAADLDPATHDIDVAYLASWQAVEAVADSHGEPALEALVRACTTVGDAEVAENACTEAMPEVLGETREQLTREWSRRLAGLGR